MLILSQDKELIVNINNKENISLKEDYYEGHFNGVKIMAKNKIYSTLGLYATKERAKEVLQEIIETYKENGTVKIDNVQIENKVVYEMPEK